MTKAAELFSSVPELNYQEMPPPIQVEEFRKTVFSRRSVRVFKQDPIPEAVVQDCLDLALLSPNSSNLQPWEFHWVRSAEQKAKLIKYCLSQPAAATAAELIVCIARTSTWKQNAAQMLKIFEQVRETKAAVVPESAVSYYQELVPFIYGQGPLGILGWVKKLLFWGRGFITATPREPTSKADMNLWAAKTVALAAQTMMLAFRAHGYDTCPLEGFDSSKVKKQLELPRDAFPVMIIAAGLRAKNGVYGPRVRFNRKQFIKEL